MREYFYNSNKIDDGHVSVRDYNLNECNNEKKDLVILHKDKKMTIPHGLLKAKAIKRDNIKYKSIFGGRDYGVYYFKWEPDIISMPTLF